MLVVKRKSKVSKYDDNKRNRENQRSDELEDLTGLVSAPVLGEAKSDVANLVVVRVVVHV